jgi:mannosyltransferase
VDDFIDNLLQKVQKDRSYQFVLLGFIVALAAALRFYKLGQWGFWGDEYITVRRAAEITGAGMMRQSISLLATHAAQNAWGVSEWSARFVAALAGVLTVPVLFVLVRRMFDPLVALIAAMLLAVSQWHIYWSQNARFYTVLLLLYSVALLFFYFGLEKDRPWYLILSLLFVVLALQERLIAAFLVPIALVYIVLLKLLSFEKPLGLHWRNLTLYFGPALLGVLFLAITNPGVREPGRWFSSFGFINNNPFWIFAGVLFYISIPLVCMAIVGALFRLSRNSRAALLLSVAAVLPLAAIMFLSLFQYTANRYVFVSLTSVIILASVAARDLLLEVSRSVKILAIGLLLILVFMPMSDNLLYYRYQNGNRDDWKGAMALIRAARAENEPVVATHRALATYYLGERTVNMETIDVARFVENKERVWFVVDLTTSDKAPEAYHWIQANAQLFAVLDVTVSARTFPMRIFVYEGSGDVTQAEKPADQ